MQATTAYLKNALIGNSGVGSQIAGSHVLVTSSFSPSTAAGAEIQCAIRTDSSLAAILSALALAKAEKASFHVLQRSLR